LAKERMTCVKFFIPQVVETNSPQLMDVTDVSLLYY